MNSTDSNSISLSESDYLAILDVIQKFHDCQTRSELKECFSAQLLPLFEAQAGLYGWTDPDINSPRLVDTFGMSSDEAEALEKFIPYDAVAKFILKQNRPVAGMDIDLTREEEIEALEQFFRDNPEADREAYSKILPPKMTGLLALDLPDPSLGVAVHWHAPFDKPLGPREIRLMELLKGHLFQAIKSVLLAEELAQYKNLAEETLSKSRTALALIRPDGSMIYRNPSLEKLFNPKNSDRLPEKIWQIVHQESQNFDPPFDLRQSNIELPFIKLGSAFLTVNLTLLKGRGVTEDKCFLVRLKPAGGSFTKNNFIMQEAGLTAREMEVCTLALEGFGENEISERLFISPHTVNTHLKNIYRKMGVHSRTELIRAFKKEKEF